MANSQHGDGVRSGIGTGQNSGMSDAAKGGPGLSGLGGGPGLGGPGMMGGGHGLGGPNMGGGGGPHARAMMPKVRPKQLGPTLLRLWSYLKRQRFGLILVLTFTTLAALASLVGPFLLGRAIDEYVLKKNTDGMLWLCGMLLGIYLLGALLSFVQGYLMAGVTQRTVQAIRRDLFAHMQKLPVSFFDKRTHGELMSRTTNDVENISASLGQSLPQVMTSLIMIVGSFAFMLGLNFWLTLVSLVSIPITILATGQIAKRTRKYFAAQQRHLGELNGFVEETLSGQKVVKAYHREEAAVAEFQGFNEPLRLAGIRAQIAAGFMGPVNNLINNFSFAFIAAFGGWLAFAGYTSIGVIVSFLNYSRQFTRPINELANQYNMIQSAIAGAERVFEVLDTETEYSTEVSSSGREIRGEVAFDNVSFGYKEGVPVLKGVSLTARPGQTIALVGPTGAGKTTVINLLTRFYEVNEGEIRIDGVPLAMWNKDGLRGQLGLVLQDAYLFSDSVRENIRYGRLDATDEEVERAAKLANADLFIRKLPSGYDTKLSAEGGNLSQGQRQLLTIARAILADPAILILDEATSNVDTLTEVHIQEAMRSLMHGRTSFVIAHRLNTIREADQILVIDGGEIRERGSHEELLAQRGFYYALYTSQFERVAG